jgi:hypothetical protein
MKTSKIPNSPIFSICLRFEKLNIKRRNLFHKDQSSFLKKYLMLKNLNKYVSNEKKEYIHRIRTFIEIERMFK